MTKHYGIQNDNFLSWNESMLARRLLKVISHWSWQCELILFFKAAVFQCLINWRKKVALAMWLSSCTRPYFLQAEPPINCSLNGLFTIALFLCKYGNTKTSSVFLRPFIPLHTFFFSVAWLPPPVNKRCRAEMNSMKLWLSPGKYLLLSFNVQALIEKGCWFTALQSIRGST